MTDKPTAALRVAVLRALHDRFAILDREVRDELMGSTTPGERLPAVLPGVEEPVGWVTRTKPSKHKPAVTVTDAASFLAWVQEHHPGEIVQPPLPAVEVRSSWQAWLLRTVQDDGGVMSDPSTGELSMPPGVEWRTPEPGRSNLMVKLTEDGAAAIEAAWAQGRLELPGGTS